MNNQPSKIETHTTAIGTVAKFSGLDLNTVVTNFKQRFSA